MLTVGAREAAARVWAIRERTEHEAVTLFSRLAADLEECRAPRRLVELARAAAADERVHATHCRAVIDSLAPGMPPLPPDASVRLGPSGAPAARRALYASVALGCVTESLSTALLLEMRAGATAPRVKEALDTILEDEVRHSRLGWAHLALAAADGDVGWLAPSVPAMLEAALASESSPEGALEGAEARAFLRAHGILAPGDVARITAGVVADVIAPGLRAHGLWHGPLRMADAPSSRVLSAGRALP